MEERQRKKIWIWNHYATEMFANQGGRHYYFARHLIERGYDVTIFCASTFHDSNEVIDTEGHLHSIKYVDGIRFVFIRVPTYTGNGSSRIINMYSFYRGVKKTARKMKNKEGKPDVIIASSVHPLTLVAGVQSSKKFGVPCICEIRDLWPESIFAFGKTRENSILGRALIAGEHWIYRRAEALIFTKEGDLDYILEKKWNKEQGGNIDLRKVHYINNGVDLESFDISANHLIVQDEDLHSEKFTVVYTGAIRPVNNVEIMLDAAILLQDEVDIQLLVYGEGTQRVSLIEKAKKEGLTNIKFKGFVNKRFIPYVLSKSDVNILNYSSTLYNWSRGNSSNKLFEYMASGRPIIATIKTGYSLIERYDCGIEIDSDTPYELAKAIIRIKELDQKRYDQIGRNARKAAAEFDFERLTDQLLDVIKPMI